VKRPSNHVKFAALWLLSQGRTQQEVATKFGVSQQTVAKWLNAKGKIREQNRQDLTQHIEKVLLGEKTWHSITC
jgi:transcriptional regulator with XRE-family HTH domain